MKQIKLRVKTKSKTYSIIIGSNLVSNISKIFKNNSIMFKKCLLIVDINISRKIIYRIKNALGKKNIYIFYFIYCLLHLGHTS